MIIMRTNGQLEPTVFVIFGGAGDLTWRKLVPALYDLFHDRRMPAHFSIIAVDRIAFSDEKLRRRLLDGVKKFSRQATVKSDKWGEFAKHIGYQQGDFKKLQTYAALGEHIYGPVRITPVVGDDFQNAATFALPRLRLWMLAPELRHAKGSADLVLDRLGKTQELFLR